MDAQIESVYEILKEMNLDGHERLILLNKCDQVDPETQTERCLEYGAYAVSAVEPKTLKPVLELVESRLWFEEPPEQPMSDMYPHAEVEE